MKRTHHCGQLNESFLGKEVCLCGWVHRRRDHGGITFIDLRDREGMTQVLFRPEAKELFSKAKDLRPEFVIQVRGKVTRRPPGTENPKLATGAIEVAAEDLTILNPSKTPPFEISDEELIGEAQTRVSEELRLTYRYLDLRRPKMQRNLRLRHEVCQIVRNFLSREGFVEVETPILTKSTPEGARDYLVPSRLNPGQFYALPQSPQLFKQLLMVAGLERYFQISRCFRDEDLRTDRQPEFTQIDLEMSFVNEVDIFNLIESLFKEIFEASLPGTKVSIPFPRMRYRESMDTYGADSPDLRFEVKLHDLTDLLRDCGFEKFESVAKSRKGGIFGMNAPSGARLSEKQIEILRKKAQEGKPGAKDLAPFKCEKGTLVSHISKHFHGESLDRVAKKLQSRDGDLVLIVADDAQVAKKALGRVRDGLKEEGCLQDVLLGKRHQELRFAWITDFPLFDKDEETGGITSSHHPFTSLPEEDEPLLSSQDKEDLLNISSQAYDIVLNGIELGSGSIRIHKRDVQEKVFEALKISKEEQNQRFGFLLEAFTYGAPPHGGIAFGLDRLVAMLVDLQDEKFSDTGGATSIREVIAFPKTQKAFCPMTEAPSEVSAKQLKELGITPQGGKR